MIVIVGGGVAGWSAANAIRDLGCEERIVMIGAEPSEPYERPVLSKGFLTEPDLLDPPPLPMGGTSGPDVELRRGTTAEWLDVTARRVGTSDGGVLEYDRLLLAQGAECRRLAVPGADLAGVHHLRELADARKLRGELRPDRRIVIVGGGVIGLEVGASARARGCNVAVIETAAHLMGRILPSNLADLIADEHRARGVVLHTQASPTGFIAAGDRVAGVVLADGATVEADVVVVGIGASPRTRLAERAGLVVRDGVLVDSRLRSSDEHVFAAGDMARVLHATAACHLRLEQWRSAELQGRVAGTNIAGGEESYHQIPSMWSDQHDLHIQAVGFGFDDTSVVAVGDLSDRAGVAHFGFRGDRLVAACGVSIGTGVARTIKSAEMLIQSGIAIDPSTMLAPGFDVRRFARSRLRAGAI